MLKQLTLFCMIVAVLSLFSAVPGYSDRDAGDGAASEEAYHNREGLTHFKKGFYDLTPHHKKEQATQEFALAVQEFQKALALNPASPQTHKNLARLYYLQGKFLQAAMHYEKLTQLNPNDIDSYVLAALSYAEAGKFAEARAQLESAKAMTTDEGVSTKLNEYLERLGQWESEGTR